MFNKDFQVISIAICSKHDEDAYVWSEEALKDKDIMQPVFDMMEDPSVLKVAQNAKYDSNAMFSSFGVVVRGLHLDTRLIRKILEPESVAKLDVLQEQVGMGGGKEIASQAIAVIARKLKKAETDIDLAEIGPIAWTKPLHNKGCALGVYAYGLIDKDVRDRYCGRDTVSTARVAELYEQRLSGTSIKTVWEDIMLPAAKAIEYVERWGVAVDREFVDKFEGVVTREKDATLSKLFMRGEFNLNSTRELGDRLYKDYKLPIVSKTATGNPSTDRATLDMLAARDLDPEQQEFVDTMLEYRKLAKMHSTYATKLGGFIRSDGRVHPSFNLVGARSGRISCLAGWTPIKTKRGFVPIKNVRVGDLVWTHKERWRPVLAQWLVGTEDTYDVTLCNGEVLTCTATHRVLNSTGSWTFIEDYINERFKEVDKRPGKPTEGSCLVQEAQPATYNKTGIRQPGGDDSERVPCVAESHAGSRKEGSSNSPVLPFQDGQEKSHEGKNGEEAPQLEGAVRRRLRLPDVYAQGEESVCSQVSVRAEHGPGTCTTASENDCPPHRQRSEEQPHRQFSTCDKRGARSYTLFTGEGFPVCSIEEINYRGSIQVYDLTVEEDESYEACGVFSHNCSDPNVQQIPRADTELSSMARDCFIAPPGRMLVQVDYSQLELRIAAMLSNDTNMIDVFKSGEDYHMRTAQLISKQAWGIEPDQVTKLHRTMAKSVNFGLLYGMSVGTLAKSIGCEKSEATKIQSAVFGSFPSLKRWCDDHVQMARRTGNGYTYWNGKKARVRPLFRIADQEDHARKTAENGSFNTPVQGTASDLCIASLARCVNWILEHKFPAKMVLTVHDSLLFEVAEDYVDEMVETAQHLMSDWESNGVPLVVDAEIGKTWGRLKNYS
jgi:DNA polymerase I-like protein with 3'-5' exonuclease and polymerase domains